MIIFGIDPGLADLGYGIIEYIATNCPLRVLAYGTIKTKKEESLSDRLTLLSQELKKLCLQYKPHVVVIEKLFFAKNITSCLNVAHARGVALLILRQFIDNDNIFEYHPAHLKRLLTNNIKATKKEMQEKVAAFFNLPGPVKKDDAADALALALSYLKKQNLI